MKIVIAPDKFAGTLTAEEASRAIATGWGRGRPEDSLVRLPLADGGEGTIEVLADSIDGAEMIDLHVSDQFGNTPDSPRRAIRLQNETVVIEVASCCGISQVAAEDRDPWRASSRPLGEAIEECGGTNQLIIGLGGSATVDGGAGLLQALGHQLLDRAGTPISAGLSGLGQLHEVIPRVGVLANSIVIAADVTTQLTGPKGAANIFGPQKGLKAGELDQADEIIARFADIAQASLGVSGLERAPSSGAAGGIGFALMCFEGAIAQAGADVVAGLIGLEQEIASADVVITGEGKLDESTTHGKGPWHIAELARTHGVPVAVIAGQITSDASANFDYASDLGPRGMVDAQALLEDRAEQLARKIGEDRPC